MLSKVQKNSIWTAEFQFEFEMNLNENLTLMRKETLAALKLQNF